MWKDFKYLLAYTMPISALLAISWGGYWSFATVIYAFGFLPVFELIFPKSKANLPDEVEQSRSAEPFFDWLLYLNLPILAGILYLYLNSVSNGGLSNMELIGMTLSVGILIGTIGINVAHELGHRTKAYEQWLGQALLMIAFNMRFFIEHNRGHHKHVATPQDPSSAAKNEMLYLFWFKSIFGTYINAWKLENSRLQRINQSWLSLDNQMLRFQLIQMTYFVGIVLVFGWTTALMAYLVGFIGVLLLESVNYIEHYGLRRKQTQSGKYEKVTPLHSWNSDHEIGRIVLYELTRHSDHHYKSTRKYQILRHFEDSPQLPFGYPMSVLVSMVPPLWFSIMNKRVDRINASQG